MTTFVNQYAGLMQAALIATAFFAMSITLVCAITYPWLGLRLAKLPPRWRANILFGWAALPLLGSVAFLLLSFTPSLLAWIGLASDHCHLHRDHPHLCLLHPPHIDGGNLLVVGALSAFGAMSIYLGGWLIEYWRTRRLIAGLVRLSRRDETRGVNIVAIDAPLAFAAGLRDPALFVSEHLLARLTPEQLTIVVAHERAHATRQDTLRQMIASLVSRLHLPPLRKRLLADLALATEQACDEQAAVAVGDRLAVASAILAVEKLFARFPVANFNETNLQTASHFVGSNVTERVHALLDVPNAFPLSYFVLVMWPALALTSLIALTQPLHHATESLLGFIFH